MAQLVSQHPPAHAECVNEKAALVVASGVLLRTAGALTVAAPTLLGEIPAITAFIGSAMAVGATAAQYVHCRDEAEAQQ